MPPRAWLLAVARLTALLTLVGLATTRIGLVAHELVGHGGTAIAAGADVTDVQLFWFAGGWIRYHLPAAGHGELAIALGGIVLEAVAGTAIFAAFRRRDGLGGRIACGIGAALIIHAGWYLATGTWHGYGDGVVIHRELGDAKWLVSVPAAVIVCVAAYGGARSVLGVLAETLSSRRIAGMIIAIVIAGGVQGGAAVGEVMVRRDAAYTQIMRPERERQIALEMQRWAELQRQRGARPSDDERAAAERDIAAKHRTFPFAWLLGVATALAIIAGARRSRRGSGEPIGRRLLVRAAVIAGASLALVIAIDLAFH